MKDLSATLVEALQKETTTIATGWRVLRVDGEVFGWTDHNEDVTIDGVLYRSSLGLTPTSAHSTNTLAVDTLDVTAFLDVATEADIVAGRWDNAEVTIFEYDWDSPPSVFDTSLLILRHGNLGPLKRQDMLFTAEIRGLAQRLSRATGRAYSPGCPWRHALWDGSTYVSSLECGVDLVAGDFIHTGTVTEVDSESPSRIFTDSASGQADDYYADGLVTFTSGENSALTREVRLFTANEYTLYRPFPFAIAVGDAYAAVIGDDKLFETCKDRFMNALNFGGFPHIPGTTVVFLNPTSF